MGEVLDDEATIRAEMRLLQACMRGPKSVLAASVSEEDFLKPQHRMVFEAMKNLALDNKPANEAGFLEHALGKHWNFCADTVISMAAFEPEEFIPKYETVVREQSHTRRIKATLYELAMSKKDGKELQMEALTKLGTMGEDQAEGMLYRDATKAMLGRLGTEEKVVKTGFPKLDERLGGLPIGTVNIIAGRPSMGKSSMARQIADNVAMSGHGVHVFTIEDTNDHYLQRVLSEKAKVNLSRLRNKDLTRGDMTRIIDAAGRDLKMFLSDARVSDKEMLLQVMRKKPALDTKLVLLDYIQLMPSEGRDKRAQVESAAEGLLSLAKRAGVAVLAVSQLSRATEAREDKRPQLSDLRETGVLEQIANSVMSIYRPGYYEKNQDDPRAELHILKNKHGRCGHTDFHFEGQYTAFSEV